MKRTILSATMAVGAVLAAASASAATIGNALINRQYATDHANNVFVVDFGVNQAGTLQSVLTWGQVPDQQGYGSLNYSFDAYVLQFQSPGVYLVAYDTGPLTVGSLGINTFLVSPFQLQASDLIAHFGQGIPLDDFGGTAETYYPADKPTVGQIINLPGTWSDIRTYSIAVDVPDCGTTAMLLGMSLLGLGWLRRKLGA